MDYPDTKILIQMSQPALHAYLKGFSLSQRELEQVLVVFREKGQSSALIFCHEIIRQRRRTEYLHEYAPQLLQAMLRRQNVSLSSISEMVSTSVQAAGELFDEIEQPAEQ